MEKKRLIDAEALWNAVEQAGWRDNADRDQIENMILDAPTIDAVPVVRCKDCKHWQVSIDKIYTWCPKLMDKETTEDDYCSFGELREGED